MEKSKRIAHHHEQHPQMIAEAVVYTEGNNFQHTLKRVTGKTPGEWRSGGDDGSDLKKY